MAFIENSEMRVYYEVHGDKAPLVLLSGMGRNHSVWSDYIEFLTEHFQIILIDNLGCGRTTCTKKPFSMEDMAKSVALVLNEVCPNQSVDILGHSMGGFIAQHVALHYPQIVNRLALISTTACQGAIPRISMDDVLALRAASVPMDLVARVFLPLAFSDAFLSIDGVVEKLVHGMVSDPMPQTIEGFEAQCIASKGHDLREEIHKITHPTLICTGQFDLLAPPSHAQLLHEKIQGSTLQIVEGVGHVIQAEAPKTLSELLLTHFSSE